MKLSKRLQTIFDMLPSCNVAADIGSDHGKLIISLYLGNKISKGYAVENKKGPFERLKKEIEAHNLLDKITPMLSDGVSELPNDTDIVIVAGMGGSLINKILVKDKDKLTNVRYIIVDPHNAIKDVREEITNIGYHITNEEIIFEDGIYYEIILFEKGLSNKLTDLEKEFGPILLKKKDEIFKAKYQEIINLIDNNLSKEEIPEVRKIELRKEKEKILEVL